MVEWFYIEFIAVKLIDFPYDEENQEEQEHESFENVSSS